MEPAPLLIDTASRARTSGSTEAPASLPADALQALAPDQAAAWAKLTTAVQLVSHGLDRPIHVGGFAPFQARRLKTYIEANLDRPLRVDEVAALVRISPSYFSRTFKRTFRQPFSKYVMTLRLERARMLLAHTDRPICEVALACGLADQPHLTRLFHRQYGAPPRAWRRGHRVGTRKAS
ncbi:hypothetical protein ASD89_01240 [Caulobacter sp. Root656]|nr:hypothetical protein ASD89_01240 [Caulobacter sp. Root656]